MRELRQNNDWSKDLPTYTRKTPIVQTFNREIQENREQTTEAMNQLHKTLDNF